MFGLFDKCRWYNGYKCSVKGHFDGIRVVDAYESVADEKCVQEKQIEFDVQSGIRHAELVCWGMDHKPEATITNEKEVRYCCKKVPTFTKTGGGKR